MRALGLLALFLIASTASAQELTFAEMAGGAVVPAALESLDDLGLTVLLDTLADEAGALPEAAFSLPESPALVIVPLSTGVPDARLFLYYRLDLDDYFFLRLGTDAAGRAEMRLWGRGAAEIWISQDAAVLLQRPSEHTFRVADPQLRLREGRQGMTAQPLTVSETVSCIARILGISLNTGNLQSLLSSATCSATNTIGLVLTAFNCLSPTPSGVLGCTLGIAKLISCNDLRCDSTPTNCRGTITVGQRVSGSWTTACAAAHQAGAHARYYTFTLTAQTRLRIELSAVFVDPVLVLREGDSAGGAVLASDDDSGLGWNSRIERTLGPGTYTLEATTRLPARTGSFQLTLTRR